MSLKATFVLRALSNYNTECIATMRIAAQRLKIGVTDEGLKSLAFKAYLNGDAAHSSLSFREYLRMVDMGAGRGHPLGGLVATKVNLQASNKSGLALVKDKVRKPKKFYSKIIYGKLTGLQSDLLYGYTEETIAMLKQELQSTPI
jgi:hypothetical protein